MVAVEGTSCRPQGLVEIALDVLNVLDTHAHADHIRGNTASLLLLVRQLCAVEREKHPVPGQRTNPHPNMSSASKISGP